MKPTLALLGLLTLTLAVVFLSACGGDDEKVLRIGYANEPPFGYLDTATNRVTGEAPEIARHIAKELGYDRVEGVLVEWGSLIPGLQSGRFDVIAAGMYITPKRAEAVLFSNPTNEIIDGFIVKAGNPKQLHSYDDIKNHADARLGVVAGTVEVGYAEQVGIPDERVVKFNSNLDAVDGVKTGQVDAFAGTAPSVQGLVAKLGADSGVELADPFHNMVIDGKPVKGYGAFAFRKGNEELRDRFNQVLADFIGSQEHLKLVEPFGFGEAQLPQGVTASDLIVAE